MKLFLSAWSESHRARGIRRGLGGVLFCAMLASAQPVAADSREHSVEARLIASSEPDWPQFRGPRRDGISDERGLLRSWPEGGPRLLWSATDLGKGYSSPVIVNGRLFLTGDVRESLHLFALDLEGRPIWRATNGLAWFRPYPGARASVTYSAGRLYHENAHGRVVCLDAENGAELWSVDLLERFGGENITWGLSECLLVDERAVYATVGGREALVVAFDKETGEELWKSEPLFDSGGTGELEGASYVSPILVQFGERRLIVGCSSRHLYCVDAETGAVQWTQRKPTSYSVLAMMPTLVGNAVFMTAPHGDPGGLYRLLPPAESEGSVGVEEVWTTELDTCQGGVVHVDGRLYGSYYPGRKGWAALDAASGEVLYEESDFVKGSVMYADGRLYALCEDGWMVLWEPGEREFAVRGRFRLAEAGSRDAWAHPVIHEGRLYLRYHETLYCYDVQADP